MGVSLNGGEGILAGIPLNFFVIELCADARGEEAKKYKTLHPHQDPLIEQLLKFLSC